MALICSRKGVTEHSALLRYCLVLILAIALTARACAESSESDYLMFKRIFDEWTAAFNARDLAQSCALFSKSLTADYQGAPSKTYSSLRNGFKKVFRDKNRRYQYRFDLHHVYRSGDLAVARITWYLSIYENGRLISSTEDRGLDVFKRSRHGKWEIVYYLAYEHDGNE